MTEQKLCPLKYDCLGERAVLNLETGKIEIKEGLCDGHRCAWWDAERSCCGVVVGR